MTAQFPIRPTSIQGEHTNGDIVSIHPLPTATAPARVETARSGVATVLLTSLAFLMVSLDALVVVTALPSIRTALGGSPGDLQWVLNAYNLTFAAGIVTGAALADRLGRKRVFLVGLALFTIASAACAIAPALGWLVAFRALQGLGGAILSPAGLALVTQAVPASRRGAAIGVWSGVAGLGVAAGPLLGGAVTQGMDWHWIFWINVPIGIVAIAGCLFVTRESHGPRRALDVPGMVLAATALATGVDAVAEAPTVGWTAPRTILLLVLAVLLAAGFVVRERVARSPMIPPRLFRRRGFTAVAVAQACSSGAIFAAAFAMSVYFQLGRGASPLEAGLQLLPWTATPFFVAPLAGALSDRLGARRLAAVGLALQAVGFVVIVGLAGSAAPWTLFIAPLVVAGVGISLALPTLPAAAIAAVGPDDVGIGAGVVNTVQRIGGVLGIAAIAAVFSAQGGLGTAATVTDGFRWALASAAMISLLGAAAAALRGRRADRMVEG